MSYLTGYELFHIKLISGHEPGYQCFLIGLSILSPVVGHNLCRARFYYPLASKVSVFFSILYEVTSGPPFIQTTFSPTNAIKTAIHLNLPILSLDPIYFIMILCISSMWYSISPVFIRGLLFVLYRNLEIVYGDMLTCNPRMINMVMGSPSLYIYPSGYYLCSAPLYTT